MNAWFHWAELSRTALAPGSPAGDWRWEKTLTEQKHSQLDPVLSVELQDGNGGAANRGTCGKDRACPPEVLLPPSRLAEAHSDGVAVAQMDQKLLMLIQGGSARMSAPPTYKCTIASRNGNKMARRGTPVEPHRIFVKPADLVFVITY